MAEKFVSVNNFTGGANNFISPLLLSNQARQLQDADVSTGNLVSAKANVNTNLHDPVNLGHYGAANKSAVKWFGKYYWSINDATAAPYYGGNDYVPGISYPPHPPTLAKSFDAASGMTAGTYKYCITCLNKDSWESAPGDTVNDPTEWYNEIILQAKNSPKLTSIAVSSGTATATLYSGQIHTFVVGDKVTVSGTTNYNGVVTLTAVTTTTLCWTTTATTAESSLSNAAATLVPSKVTVTLPSVPSGTTTIRLYRTAADGATYYMVKDFDASLASSTYDDALADLLLLQGNTMVTEFYLPPPGNGKYLTQNAGYFYLAVDEKLYYSIVENPHAWNPSSYIVFDDTITGIVPEFQGLLIFTANRVYRLTGTDVNTFNRQEIPGQQGCRNYLTIARLSNAPVWVSNDGICLWDGSSIKVVTNQKYLIDFAPVCAVAGNDIYYLFYATGCLIYDVKNGGIFYTSSTENCQYAWYDVDRDTIYLLLDEGDTDTIYSLGGGSQLQGVYHSGNLGALSALTTKELLSFIVSSNCDVRVIIYSDFDNSVLTLDVSGSGRRRVWLPTGTMANELEIEIQWTGTVFEFGFGLTEQVDT